MLGKYFANITMAKIDNIMHGMRHIFNSTMDRAYREKLREVHEFMKISD